MLAAVFQRSHDDVAARRRGEDGQPFDHGGGDEPSGARQTVDRPPEETQRRLRSTIRDPTREHGSGCASAERGEAELRGQARAQAGVWARVEIRF